MKCIACQKVEVPDVDDPSEPDLYCLSCWDRICDLDNERRKEEWEQKNEHIQKE